MLRFKGGARGMLWCSQVAAGKENDLRLRVFGTKAGIEWSQEEPNYLHVTPLGGSTTRITRAGGDAGPAAARVTRVPPGHPEGYLEGFANIYAEAARAIVARRDGVAADPAVTFPGIADGVAGVAFVDACVRSSARNAAWVSLNT
jgi:predicted dehydrogenase